MSKTHLEEAARRASRTFRAELRQRETEKLQARIYNRAFLIALYWRDMHNARK